MSARRFSPDEVIEVLGFDPATEGLETAPAETADLVALALLLEDAGELAPAAGETERLLGDLVRALPAPETPPALSDVARAMTEPSADAAGWLTRTLTTIRPQVRVLGRPFWLASVAVILAGLPLLRPELRDLLGAELTYSGFLVLVAPILAALGVAYAFRSTGTGMAEVEMTCALSPAQLLLGRLFWVACYDAALLAAASLLAVGLEPGVQLGYLVLGWLTPMLLLAAGALAASLYVPPWAGAAAALLVWSGVLGAGLRYPQLFLPRLAGTPGVVPVALLFGLGALLLLGALAAAAPRLIPRLLGEGDILA